MPKEGKQMRKTRLSRKEAQAQLDAYAVINSGVEQLAKTLQDQGFDPEPAGSILDSYKEAVNDIGQDIGEDKLRYSWQAGGTSGRRFVVFSEENN